MPDTDPRLREILDAFAASQFDDIAVQCEGVRLHAVKDESGAVRVVDSGPHPAAGPQPAAPAEPDE